ncbi:MAG TPA: polysaccharide deacetylase family protein [Clostridia bacterium]|nr:polysaccharide deacetylase family protein [Clostridia bacterium]
MTFVIRTFIKYLLLPLGVVYSLLFGPKDEVLMLMYHRVENRVKKELAVSPQVFLWQMNYLHKKGLNVISMDEAYSMITRNGIKGRHVVLTFDDGYKDFYTNAYPILKKFGFPSIMFLCPGYIDTNKKYWWDQDEEQVKLMGWKDIYRLNKEGLVAFGSHTIEHADMDKLSMMEMEKELGGSQKLLEEKLGINIPHFAYPRGIYSKVGEDVLKKYYDTGVLTSNGKRVDKKCSTPDTHILKRIPVLKSDGRYLFVARLKGWLVVEDFIRKHLFS